MATTLPYDIFVLLVSYLPVDDIKRISYVCKSWHRHVVFHPSFWRDLVKNTYPNVHLHPNEESRLCLHLICLKPNTYLTGVVSRYLMFLQQQEFHAYRDKKPFCMFIINPGPYYPVEFGFRHHLSNLLVSAHSQCGALLKIHHHLPSGKVDFYTSLIKQGVLTAYPHDEKIMGRLHQHVISFYIKVVSFRAIRIAHH